MRRGRLAELVLAAAVVCIAGVATGCGSSGDDSASPERWASGVCSSITTWQAALTSAADSVRSDPTKDGVQTAADDAKSATETLESDLNDLGKPDTEAGEQAKKALDGLSTNLKDGADSIEEAVQGVSDLTQVPAAVSAVTATLTTMRTQIKSALADIRALDAKGELESAFAGSSECDSLTASGS